jgi:hypothetical protein
MDGTGPGLRLEQTNSSSRKDDVERKKNKPRKKDGKKTQRKVNFHASVLYQNSKSLSQLNTKLFKTKECTSYRNLH